MRTLFALVFSLLVATPALAQPSVSATIGVGPGSISGDGSASASTLQANAEVQHQFLSTRARLFYEIGTGDYASDGDWRFMANSGGFSYRFDAGRRWRVYLGTDAGFRRNGDAWSAAGFNAVGTFANLEWEIPRGMTRGGYRLDIRRFPSMSALDQTQHTVFGSVLLNFQTRTTVIAEASLGAKDYAAVSSTTELTVVPASTTPEGQRGRAHFAGMANTLIVPVMVPGSPGSTARQVTGFGRVAQSLAARTGLSVEGTLRRVSGEVSPALIATPPMFMDDGVYDDPFASDLDAVAVRLTSIVGPGIELVASAETRRKRYPGTPAFAEDSTVLEGVLRNDRVFLADLGTAWPLFPSRTGAVSLDLLASYEFTRSESTSAWYRYRGHALRFGVGIGY